MRSRQYDAIWPWVWQSLLILGFGLGWTQVSWGADASTWQRDYKESKKGRQTRGADKVSSHLWAVVAEIETHGVAAASNPLVRVDDKGRLQSYIYVSHWGVEEASQLKRHEVLVERRQSKSGVVQAWIPFDQISQVAQLDFITRIAPPVYAGLRPPVKSPDRSKLNKMSKGLQGVLRALKQNVVRPEQRAEPRLETFSTPLVRVNQRGAIHVNLHVTELNASRLAALEAKGFELEIANTTLMMIQGWVPYEHFEDVTSETFIQRVEAPRYGTLQSVPVRK